MRELTDAEVKEVNSIRWFHSIPVGYYKGKEFRTPGEVAHSCDGDTATKRFGLPKDLTGKSVLDIGAWDGGFSFEAEKRGAELVVASDIAESSDHSKLEIGNWGGNNGFKLARKLLDSKVKFIEASINDLGSTMNLKNCLLPEKYDITLFLGVLYHLIDPLSALIDLRSVTKDTAIIETAISKGNDCRMDLRNGNEGDYTNWWYPTIPCVHKMLECVGFSSSEVIWSDGIRATFVAKVDGSGKDVNRVMKP